jgi:hypothetical protein
MITAKLVDDLRQLSAETFEIEDINDLGLDAPGIMVGDEELMAEGWCSSSCSCSSCCSCSTSSCCSCSCSCSSTSSCG